VGQQRQPRRRPDPIRPKENFVRILFVCHRMPYPPSDGARVRAFHIIRHLARSHEVTVAAPTRSADELRSAEQLKQHCSAVITGPITRLAAAARMVKNLATATPSSMGFFYSPQLAARIRQAVSARPFDMVFVYCSSVAPYVEGIEGTVKVIDFVDMDSQKWLVYAKAHRFPLSLGYWLEGTKLRREEACIANAFDLSMCVTPGELATLRSFGVNSATGVRSAAGVRSAIGWFPNGVDLDYFAPTEAPYDPNAICFVGRMDYFPNQQAVIDFCDHVLPQVQKARPEASFTIIGAEPPRAVRELARRLGVSVTGTVADVRAFVRRSAVSVAPLRIARGVQNKILEAMAMGVPVVASPQTASGIEAVPGRHLMVAANAEAMASAVIRLLCDGKERARLAHAAREHVVQTYSWEEAMRQMDALLAPLVDSRRKPSEILSPQ
jgi:sugar transferase (PEP-CTERM/EpsH1 system associated)